MLVSIVQLQALMKKKKKQMAMMEPKIPHLQMSPLLNEGQRDARDGAHHGLLLLEQLVVLMLPLRRMKI